MYKRTSLNSIPATATAALSAVVNHTELGLFVSELKVGLPAHGFRENCNYLWMFCEGRTNENKSFWATVVLVQPDEDYDPEKPHFPFSKIFVSLESDHLGDLDNFFECTMEGRAWKINNIAEWPYPG